MRHQDQELEKQIDLPVRQMQIITVATLVGLLILAGMVLVIAETDNPVEGVLSSIALGLGLVGLVVQSIIGAAINKQGITDWAAAGGGELAELVPTYQKSLIVTLAINEGPAFLNLMVYGFIEPAPLCLAMAGLLMLANATKFPTVGRVADWCRRQARLAEERGQWKRP